MKTAIRFDEVVEAAPETTAELLVQIAAVAEREGRTLYLVGGPVRDLLLGRALVDVDLMVEQDAVSLADAVVAAAPEGRLQRVEHSRFGTVRIESGQASIDVARLRHETYAHPGALPDVGEGTLEQDVRRRDFSVNALVCPLRPDAPASGEPVIDLVGGLEDLGRGRLRVLHERSFHDDPTRAWRAARLAVRLGFRLDRSSRNLLRDALRDGAFGAVSGDRLRRELQLVFAEAERGVHPGRILRLLSDWHVLAALEPGLGLQRDRMLPLRRLGRAVAAPEWPAPRWRPWISGLCLWLAPLPAALRRRTLERFAVRGEQAARIVRFGRDADRLLRGLARARGRGAVDALLSEQPEEIVQALFALADASVRRRILRWGAEDRRRRPPVTGADLVALGLEGPAVGRALARIRAGFLDGEVANREEALALAEELARRASQRARRRKSRSRPDRNAVAARRSIADTDSDDRRSTASPGNASPQADPTR
jgi:tRNA nucleotidyltransferase (CCA-adding enzyme)